MNSLRFRSRPIRRRSNVYSRVIVEKKLRELAVKGHKFERSSIDRSLSMKERFARIVDKGKLSRKLTKQEEEFMRSEIIVCRYDFRYWAERYGTIERDAQFGGGIGPIEFWESQERALELIGQREEQIQSDYTKLGYSGGIQAVWHKSRQLGATAIMRLISMHRMTMFKNMRCLAGSMDEEKVHLLYVKDKVVYDNLPFFLRPEIEFDVKDEHIALANLKSRLTYQKANVRSGVGVGGQFDISHLTEIALWDNPYAVKFQFFPAIPKSPNTFVSLESTANGRGKGNFWFEFTESVRRKDRGFEQWLYIFTPCYIASKNRLPAPDDWRPGEEARRYAEMVENTSAEWVGHTIYPSREHLYWWETEYKQAEQDMTLHFFLTNHCATPEQSFQHVSNSALPIKVIEWMRSMSKNGMPYMIQGSAA